MSAEYPCVWVVDGSPVILETAAIVLGGAYDVRTLTTDECRHDPGKLKDADVLILADDALSAEALTRLRPNTPVLWLQSHAGTPPAIAAPWAAIPRIFTPEDLRARVKALLADRRTPRRALGGRVLLDYPRLPRDAAHLVRRAASTHVPVLICGEPGTGKTRVARTVCALGQNDRLVALTATSCTRAALEQAGQLAAGDLTVFVNDVVDVNHQGQQLLLELLDCGGFLSSAGWHLVRLICATRCSLEELAADARFTKGLFYRLGVLPITLPPLRERVQDVPALVQDIAAELTHALGVGPVEFSPSALERLSRYLWFGNLAEFETVLTRTIALAPTSRIETEHLLFGYERLRPTREPDSSPTTARPPAEPESGQGVDLIIHELAHEFRNPMVTIKTIAQHLERLLGDESGREQVARLTGEAVQQMDRSLDNLLQFTRFGSPTPHSVPLNSLLTPCLTSLTSTLSERRVVLDYRPVDQRLVFVDAEQIVYALENLLRAITRDLPEGQTLSIHALASDPALTFQFSGVGYLLVDKLAQFLDHPHNGEETALPLGLLFAKTLIERNGGRVDIHSGANDAAITVWLPSREEIKPGNGQAKNLNS